MTEEQNEAERRKFVRINTQNLLTCQIYTIPSSSGLQEDLCTKNISAGGLLFESKEKFDLNDILRLEINLPGWEDFKPAFYKPSDISETRPLVILGKVVRIESLEHKTFDVGVKIEGIDEGHHMALEKYINECIKNNNS